jgi:hypothetical protein
MIMKVRNSLSAFFSAVCDNPVPFVVYLHNLSNFKDCLMNFYHNVDILLVQRFKTFNVNLWNNKHMYGRSGINIMKRNNIIVFKNLF